MTRQEWIDQEIAIVLMRRGIRNFDLAGQIVPVNVSSNPIYTHTTCGFTSGLPDVFWDHLIECRMNSYAIQVDWK